LFDITKSKLYNEDLAPVSPSERTWGMWSITALWVSMAVSILTYTFSAGMISQGMTWWQAMLVVLLGNLIVLIPMILNSHAGTRYGIPFPVILRASFGTIGANIPAIMRALVACGWFGIQTWIGGAAIYTLSSVLLGFEPAGPSEYIPVLGLSFGQLLSFLLFWAINIGVILAGINSIKLVETLSAPFLLVLGLGLLWWGVDRGGGFDRILSDETIALVRGVMPEEFNFWRAFWPNLTAMVGFWATLSLNIPDFTRYATSQRDQMLGQLIGLPLTMTLYAFIGITVTSATVLIFGEAIWDPVVLLGRFENPFVIVCALFGLTIATLSTNIAANVVSPANDFSNLWPKVISFKRGGLITGVIGIVIFPWRLYTDLSNYVFTWLIGYGALLGSIGGIMIADYFIIRRTVLDADELFNESGEYSYGGRGFNWRAMVAMVVGILPNVPGFIAQASHGGISIFPALEPLYTYAWFVSLACSMIVYIGLSKAFPDAHARPSSR
jgi:NCS1 family nucleobase:cation symporter-1